VEDSRGPFGETLQRARPRRLTALARKPSSVLDEQSLPETSILRGFVEQRHGHAIMTSEAGARRGARIVVGEDDRSAIIMSVIHGLLTDMVMMVVARAVNEHIVHLCGLDVGGPGSGMSPGLSHSPSRRTQVVATSCRPTPWPRRPRIAYPGHASSPPSTYSCPPTSPGFREPPAFNGR
jgi:hypothetical protein